MTIALIADIHGNLAAFDAVLEVLEQEHPDEIVCLGDVAATGPQPREVVQRLRTLGCPVVMGSAGRGIARPTRGRRKYQCSRLARTEIVNPAASDSRSVPAGLGEIGAHSPWAEPAILSLRDEEAVSVDFGVFRTTEERNRARHVRARDAARARGSGGGRRRYRREPVPHDVAAEARTSSMPSL